MIVLIMTLTSAPLISARVPSASEPGREHDVHLTADGRVTCSCIGHQKRATCRHSRSLGSSILALYSGFCPFCGTEGRLSACETSDGGAAVACGRCEFAMEVER